VLGRDLARLSHEEVSFARDALAACTANRLPDTYDASFAAASGQATGATAHMTSPPAEATVVHAAVRPRLRIQFFGFFELLCDGEAVSLGRNTRALAILKYLLAHRGGRPVAQDYLMGWLWPESDPKRARWSLNSAVHALRKMLGGCLPSLPAPETVLFKGGAYLLSPRVLLSADTDQFASCYEEGLQLEEAGRVAEAVAEYEKAVDLYRGDYLSEDLYEEWTMIERERLSEAYVDLSRRLALCYIEGGRLREGVRTCYRVLEKDRSDEDAHRLLMECFIRLGQRGRALRQYRFCEQALRDDYEVPPSPRTRASSPAS
jgi:DNA-binding SARP family transcriptional activator